MKDRSEASLFGEAKRHLAILDFGVFVVASSTHSRREHNICCTYVPRLGPVLREPPWAWTTTACPNEIAQGVVLRAEAFTLDAIGAVYGLQGKFPQ
jgi:hypothetical protein